MWFDGVVATIGECFWLQKGIILVDMFREE